MSLDGKKYRDAAMTLPTYYHPAAPFQSQAVANCLQNAYFSAQQNSRMILQQPYISNVKRSFYNQTDFMIEASIDVLIAKGYALIPEGVTDVCASVVFGAMSSRAGSVDHKIVVTNTTEPGKAQTATSTSPISRTALSPRLTYSNLSYPPILANVNLIDYQPVAVASVSVAIESAGVPAFQLDELCTVELYAHAYHLDAASNHQAESYRPHFVSLYWEIRAE